MQRRFVRPLSVGLTLIFFQQITGQPSVLYYAGQMFQKAGLRMGQQSAGIAGILGAFKLVMTGARRTCPLFPRLQRLHDDQSTGASGSMHGWQNQRPDESAWLTASAPAEGAVPHGCAASIRLIEAVLGRAVVHASWCQQPGPYTDS